MSISLDTLSIRSLNTVQQTAPTFDRKAAEETFWGLKDQFWKQIIDGRFHQYGPMVFDEGLSGTKEPGFFKSMKDGCEYASNCLGEKPTVLFYKELHRRMCSHFMGEINNTDIQAYECGEFRSSSAHFDFYARNLDEESLNHYRIVDKSQMFHQPESIDPIQIQKSVNWVENFKTIWKAKFEVINKRIQDFCTELGFPVVTAVNQTYEGGFFNYYKMHPEELEMLIGKLFDHYNQKMDRINQDFQLGNTTPEEVRDEKIEAIADLYQKLEWIHPFKDGQGRTDLVLLSKLLCDEGLNPPILMQPYVSSWELLDDWKEYLKKGIQLWQDEKSGVLNHTFKTVLPSQTYQTKQSQPDLSIPGAETFWGLGEDYWKQFIDSRLHSCNLKTENGYTDYLASIDAGSVFATEHLGKKLDIVFYRTLNYRLCSFDHDKASKGGKFRDQHTGYTFSTVIVSKEENQVDMEQHFDCASTFHVNLMLKRNVSQQENAEFDKSIKEIEAFHTNWEKRISEINAAIQKFSSELQIPVVASLEREYGTASYTYAKMDPLKFEELVNVLFEQYNQKIDSLNSKIKSKSEFSEELRDQKIEAIADLFQKLEWLNPFQHDQGKTDLILLSKLLCEEGFNPPILRLAFTSSWTLPKDWKDYLKAGIQQWRELQKISNKRKRIFV